MERVHDFTKGNPVKIIMLFFMPMLVSNMLQQLYNFADAAIVANGLGDDALAAVGNMGTLMFLILGFSQGVAAGFGVPIAKYFGAADKEKLIKSVSGAAWMSVILTVVMTLLSVVFLKKALVFMQTDEIIMDDCLTYGYIVFGGLFSTIAYNYGAFVLRALGNSRTPFIAIIVSSVVNIVLDIITIYYFKTGVAGPALATVVSQLISAAICFRSLLKIDFIHFDSIFKYNDFSIYPELIKNGIPMAVMNSITAVGCMVVQFFVNGNGTLYTAAYAVCIKYIDMFMQPAFTAGIAMSSFTGQNFGARDFKRIKKGLWVCLAIAFATYVIFGSVMLLYAGPLAGIFLENEKAIELTVEFLHICGWTIIIVDCLFIVRSGLQGMGYPFLPMLSGVAEMFIRVAVVIFLSEQMGFAVTAYAEVAAWIGAFAMNGIGFLSAYNREKAL